MKFLIRFIMLTACTSLVFAATPRPDDYAEGFPIAVTTPGAIVTVPLTLALYRAAVSERLDDIAVFNGQSEPVPHSLRAPGAAAGAATIATRRVALPVFPLQAHETRDRPATISITAGGALVRIDSGVVTAPAAPANRYLIDASHIDSEIVTLHLDFDAGPDDLLAVARLDTGRDLDRWRTVVAGRQLANLRYDGHTLEQLRIAVPANNARYLRLELDHLGAPRRLTGVQAEIEPVAMPRSTSRRLSLGGQFADAEPAALEFDLGAALPVREIGLVLTPNELFEAVLQSRADRESAWVTRQRDVYYALERDDVVLRPGPLRVGAVAHRYWRLTQFSPAAPDAAGLELEVDWQPAELAFVANGPPPYTLAVGRAPASSDAPGSRRSPGRLAALEASGRGVLGESFELGGAERRLAATTVPWQRIGLWFVLLLGVAGAGVMVLKLLRQMRE